jgi:hypothetical protein
MVAYMAIDIAGQMVERRKLESAAKFGRQLARPLPMPRQGIDLPHSK